MKPILDISYYQPSSAIDYDAMSAAISGVIIRAAYGSGVPNRWDGADIEFENHYREFTRRGVPVGAYQFITEYQPISEQVGVAMNAINGKTLQLGFWADVELENNAEPLTKKTVDEYLGRMDAYVTGIYTSKVQWQRIMGSTPYYNEYKLWVAHYGATTPWLPQGANGYWLWQNHGTETGRIAGYARGVDLSQFYGTQAEFDAWVGAVVTPPEPEPEPVGLPYEASVTAGVLNVRASAGGTIIGKLNIGNKVTVYEEAGDWVRVNAWVSQKYIKRVTNLPPAPPPSGTLAVEPYSQNDPRWKNNRLGTSSTTIGWNGCLITCVAMVQKFYGIDTDPARLNTWLTQNGGYANENLLYWGKIPFPIATWVDCMDVPAPLSQIDACLDRGEPVIVHVDFVPSSAVINDHYVLLIGKLANEDYVMIDSWDGWQGSFKSRYKDAKRFVYRIVSYRRQA